MNVKTTFIEREELKACINSTITKFKNLHTNSSIALSENLYPMRNDSYHFIGQMLKRFVSDNRAEQMIASEIFKSIYQAEIISAGAGYIALQFAFEFAQNLYKTSHEFVNENKIMQDYEKYIKKFHTQLSLNSKVATAKDVFGAIEKVCEDDLLTKAVWEAIQLAGLEGRIFVENGRQDNYLVELKEGYTFNLKPFTWMLNDGTWERNECKVLVVDGLVEKVSEIDQILAKAYELKQPMVIVALGFSEEVVATLKANMDRGLLDIQPVRVPSDLNSLNVTNDIAITAGCLPVSSMKGDLITFVKWEEVPTVDKVRILTDKMIIENGRTRKAVSQQVSSLLQKRMENHEYEDIQNILDGRIRSLVSNAVEIYLPNVSSVKNDELRVKIDIALRQSKTILNYGTVDYYQAVKDTGFDSEFEKIIYNSLKATQLHDQRPPMLSVAMGCMLAGKAILQLYVASGFVKIIF